MPETNKMKCADCGLDMNHHADKIDYSREINSTGATDLGLGGVLKEVHSCSGCGKTALRIGG